MSLESFISGDSAAAVVRLSEQVGKGLLCGLWFHSQFHQPDFPAWLIYLESLPHSHPLDWQRDRGESVGGRGPPQAHAGSGCLWHLLWISLAYGKEGLPGKAGWSQRGSLTESSNHLVVSGKESHLGHFFELTLCL